MIRPAHIFAICLIVIALPVRGQGDERHEPARWAIVASPQVQESGLADLLFAKLSREEGIELVERERLDAAVKELALSALSGSMTAGRLKLGQTLQADALMLLSLQDSDSGEFVRLVISDCDYGARLGTELLPYETGQVERTAEQAVTVVRKTQAQYAGGIRWMAAVPRFVSRDLDHRYDHLQVGCAALVENSLGQVPGVAVVELEEAQSIRRELDVAGGTLRDRVVPLFVEGEYRTIRSEPSEVKVSLDIRLTNGDETIRKFHSAEVPLAAVPDYLTGDLRRAILQTANVTLDKPIDRDQQFAALVRRADAFTRVGSWQHATGLREAAILLRPDDAAQRDRITRDYARLIPHFINGPKPVRRPAQVPLAEQAAMWQAGLAHLEHLICHRRITFIKACHLVNEFLPTYHFHGRYGYELSIEHQETLVRFFRTVAPIVPPEPGAHPLTEIRHRHDWLRIAVESTMARVFAYRSGNRQKQNFDLLFEMMEDWPQDDYVPSSPLSYRIYSGGIPRRFSVTDRAFHQEYVGLLQRLTKSKHPINGILGRFGLLVNDFALTRRKATAADVAEMDLLLRKLEQLGPTYNSSNTSTLERHLTFYRNAFRQQVTGEVPRMPPAPPGPASEDFGRVRFEPLEFEFLQRDGKPAHIDRRHRDRWPASAAWTPCGPGLDVLWSGAAIRVMRKPGQLQELASSHDPCIDDVKWDGRHIWIASSLGVAILSPAGRVVEKITETSGLPPADNGILLHVLAEGRLAAVGSFGPHKRAWCAMLTYTNDEAKVHVFHRATTVPKLAHENLFGGPDAPLDPETVFVPTWMHVFQPTGENEPARLLIGHGGTRALIVNLKTLEVRGYSRSAQPYHFPGMHASSATYFSRNGKLLAANSLVGASLYEPVEDNTCFQRVRGSRGPISGRWTRGTLVLHDGWVYSTWSRFNPETFEEERLGPDRMPSGYRWLRLSLSSHYGLIACGGEFNKVYRVTIEED